MSRLANNPADLFNSSPPDNETQRGRLAIELHTARGFTLIFAVCSLWEEAERQRKALIQELSDLRIQQVHLPQETPHLLDLLRHTLQPPLPDAIFVYGMENWIPDTANPKSIPFLLNLNASRNNFIKDCPVPLVFWVPEYLYGLIARAAPDFTSVRSGFYLFTATETGAKLDGGTFAMLGWSATHNLFAEEKQERIATLTTLLARIRSLPAERRDEQAEWRILGQLADTYHSAGLYREDVALREQMLAIAQKIFGKKHLSTANNINDLGIVYRNLGRWKEAIACYNESLAIFRELNKKDGESRTLNNLGSVYRDQGRLEDALACFKDSLTIKRELGDKEGEGSALGNLGAFYLRQGRLEEALACFNECLAIFIQIADRDGEAKAHGNLGSVYFRQGLWQEAVSSFNACLVIKRELGDKDGIASALNNLALVYRNQGRWEEAFRCFNDSLAIKRELGDRNGAAITLQNIAGLFAMQGDFAVALGWQQQTLAELEITEDERAREEARNFLARLEAQLAKD